jgi:Protein of unknown function (DUF3800)
MKNQWVFMDETGVLANDPQQRFFALGMLKLEQTATLYEQVHLLLQRIYSKIGTPFEFKFNQINNTNKAFYIQLVDLFFQFPDLYFKAFVLDKQHPNIDIAKHFSSTWEAQIAYAKLLLRHSVDDDEQVAVIADYLGKPKAATSFFETEVVKTMRLNPANNLPLTFNVCMLESDASLLIQLVDVLLGLTAFDCKMSKGALSTAPNQAKLSVLMALRTHLGVTDLCQTQELKGPPYFGVWLFEPK